MNNTCRLNVLKKEKGLTNWKIGELIGLGEAEVGRYCRGEVKIPEDVAQRLSDMWGIRKEYIIGEDNYRTDEDLYQFLDKKTVSDMQAAIQYLKALSLELIPCNALNMPLTSVYDIQDEVRKYISNEEWERVINKYDFNLPSDAFHKKYFGVECFLKMSAPIPNITFLESETFSDNTNKNTSYFLSVSDENNPFKVNCEIIVYFNAYKDKTFIRTLNVHTVQEFIKVLGMYTKFSIDNILLNSSEEINPCIFL